MKKLLTFLLAGGLVGVSWCPLDAEPGGGYQQLSSKGEPAKDDKPAAEAESPGVPAAVVELKKEGFGAVSKGGEGGKVIWVTNRDTGGEGSFAAALQAEEPRIIKFKLGGVIKHEDMVRTKNGGKCSRVTIDGLSAAPYGGITIEGGIFFIACEDVIVRHIRIRHARGGSGNCINMNGCKRVLIDHVSMSWATDQVFGALGCEDVTYQWCIAAEGLLESDHPKGPHSCGCLIGDRNFTVHHCLFTGNWGRNPLWGPEYRAPPGQKQRQEFKDTGKFTPWLFDFVNNTFYNYGHGGQTGGGAATNFVGNYYRPGPDSPGRPEILMLTAGCKNYADFPPPRIHCKDNIGPHRLKSDMDEFSLLRLQLSSSPLYGVYGVPDPSLEIFVSRKPFDTPKVTTEPVMEGYAKVLQYGGAFPRDKTDERLIWEVLEKKGIIGAKGMFPRAAPRLEEEINKLQGAWTASSMETAGKKLPDEELPIFKFIVKDDRVAIKASKKSDWTYRLDSTKKPGEIDLTASNGPLKGKAMLGIYAFDGDVLKLCLPVAKDKGNRPAGFATTPESATISLVLKRDPPVPPPPPPEKGALEKEVEEKLGEVRTQLWAVLSKVDANPKDANEAAPALRKELSRIVDQHAGRLRPQQGSMRYVSRDGAFVLVIAANGTRGDNGENAKAVEKHARLVLAIAGDGGPDQGRGAGAGGTSQARAHAGVAVSVGGRGGNGEAGKGGGGGGSSMAEGAVGSIGLGGEGGKGGAGSGDGGSGGSSGLEDPEAILAAVPKLKKQ